MSVLLKMSSLLVLISVLVVAQTSNITLDKKLCLSNYYAAPDTKHGSNVVICNKKFKEAKRIFYYNIYRHKCVQTETKMCTNHTTKNNFETMKECEEVMHPLCKNVLPDIADYIEKYDPKKNFTKLPGHQILTSAYRVFTKSSCNAHEICYKNNYNYRWGFFYDSLSKTCRNERGIVHTPNIGNYVLQNKFKPLDRCPSEAHGNLFRSAEECLTVSSLICHGKLPSEDFTPYVNLKMPFRNRPAIQFT